VAGPLLAAVVLPNDPARIVHAFLAYVKNERRRHQPATGRRGVWDLDAAAAVVLARLVALLPGDPWKGPHGGELPE
jgi:hypothetical protein